MILNTIKSFVEEGFKIVRNGEIITLTKEEISDIFYLNKVMAGQDAIQEVSDASDFLNEKEKDIIGNMKEDYNLCYKIQDEFEEAVLTENNDIKYDIVMEYLSEIQYQKIIQEERFERKLINDAKKHGITLCFKQTVNKERQSSVWYSGLIATATKDDLVIEITANNCYELVYDDGETKIEIPFTENGNDFFKKIGYVVPSDTALEEACEDDVIKYNVLIGTYDFIIRDKKTNEILNDGYILEEVFFSEILDPSNLKELFNLVGKEEE